jgi:serine/threonine-protein kinase
MAVGLESQLITPSGSEVRQPDASGDAVEDDRFGPYRILGLIGEGGMGEVYRAHDPRMGRDVAIKVSAVRFTGRFEREVHAAAALSHPNVCHVYDVGPNYLVMELVEGPTLADRIQQSALPLEEALAIARQIADALEAAHEKGIIHRDLKPANVKITPDGVVKVLDFGLAKIAEPASAVSPESSPAVATAVTQVGQIMGTPAYMAPEQARGNSVDRRADIWAFGVVLYEMLAGHPLFTGTTTSDTLASVLKTEPDLAAVPALVRPIVERCLRKDPRQRWHCMGDLRLALEEGMSTAPIAEPRRNVLPWVVAGGFAIATVIALWTPWRDSRPAAPTLMRLSVDLGPDALFGTNHTAAISPDGTRLVFPSRGLDGKQHLAIRLLEQTQATVLPGTENGMDPIFSPDGREIGFFSNGSWKKIPFQGGATVTLGGATYAFGATLGEDGSIILSSAVTSPLYRVLSPGAAAKRITEVTNGENTHHWPQMLPGGQAVLFTASPNTVNLETSNIEAMSFKTGEKKILVHGGYYGRYLPSGHLVYMHEGVLYGVAFDADRLEVHGDRVALLEDVAYNPLAGSAQFDFSTTGTLVYTTSKTTRTWPIVWLDDSGNTQPLLSIPGVYSAPSFSPNGRQLAVTANTTGTSYVFVFDSQRGNLSRLTATVDAVGEAWAPDSKHIVFGTADRSGYGLSWVRSDGAGEAQRLLETAQLAVPWSFSPDGKQLGYFLIHPERQADIWTLPLDISDPDHPKAGKPELFLGTPAVENTPAFSPDGRWIAYRSNETGSNEVYVRPFPARPGSGWQISEGGGMYGMWSKNSELFYETADNRIMVVDYSVDGDSFIIGKRRLWSDRRLIYDGRLNLALHPDGKRFAVFEPPKAQESERNTVHVTFLLNFFDYLRRRIPTGK